MYCNFYSIVNQKCRDEYVNAVVSEIECRKQMADGKINTVYFGGGTPTLLPIHSLKKILDAIKKNFDIATDTEYTIEANPEQCTLDYLTALKKLQFNRISIGIQSFNDDVLIFLGRTHSGKDAWDAVKNAKKTGFVNISVDLIYGIDLRSIEDWKKELKTVFELPIKHLSAYSLSVEENTVLYKKFLQFKTNAVDEDAILLEMQYLMEEAKKNDFEHYEVSNFALKEYYSQHNSNYWNGTSYLGFGASAHSYTGTTRSWNISKIDKYIDALNNNKLLFEEEKLTKEDQYNEYVLLRLRMKKGVNLQHLEATFGSEKRNYFLEALQKINPLFYNVRSNYVEITKEGLLLLDFITEKLFYL